MVTVVNPLFPYQFQFHEMLHDGGQSDTFKDFSANVVVGYYFWRIALDM